MSESGPSVEVWEAPFFEQPSSEERKPLAEIEAAARAQGFEQGRSEGLAQGLAEAEHIVARLRSLASQMAAPYTGLEDLVAKELTQLSTQLARRIVQRELSVDSSHIAAVVEQALETLYRLEGEVVIFLHPTDAALLRDFSPEALEGKTWKITEDESIAAGGCQVKTPSSFVDASVEKQLETLFDSLVNAQDPDPGD